MIAAVAEDVKHVAVVVRGHVNLLPESMSSVGRISRAGKIHEWHGICEEVPSLRRGTNKLIPEEQGPSRCELIGGR